MSFAKLRNLLSASIASCCLVALCALVPMGISGCSGGGDDDGTTAPPPSPCAEASFSSYAEIGFNLGCAAYSSSVSGITYDQFSRVTSYNYDISCAGGGSSSRKAGRVYNITYNNIGVPLSWDYTVNGATCRKS